MSNLLKIGGHTIEITHPEKVLFPSSGITKQDIINYYVEAAPFMVPYVKNRPLSMFRCPSGINDCFYQKNKPEFYPDWIRSIPVEKSDKTIIDYVDCANNATLIYLANNGCLTFHPWLSKLPALNNPDKIVFDLDPSLEDFRVVRKTALILRDIIKEYDLVPFAMLTGSKGIHVVIPIKPTHHFDTIRALAKTIAEKAVQEMPAVLTTDVRFEHRTNKIFIDYLRNAWSATSVAPYSVRHKEGAPVAMPISWDELQEKSLQPTRYTIYNALSHMKENVWKDFNAMRKTVKKLYVDL